MRHGAILDDACTAVSLWYILIVFVRGDSVLENYHFVA